MANEADRQAALAGSMQLPSVPVGINREALVAAFASMGIDTLQLCRADFTIRYVELEFYLHDSRGQRIAAHDRFSTMTVRVPITSGTPDAAA